MNFCLYINNELINQRNVKKQTSFGRFPECYEGCDDIDLVIYRDEQDYIYFLANSHLCFMIEETHEL